MKKAVLFIVMLFTLGYANAQSPTFQWAKAIWSSGKTGVYSDHSIAADASGNVYITGYYSDSVDFDPGPGSFNLYLPPLSYNAFLLKLDAQGNFVWLKEFGGVSASAMSTTMKFDIAGNIYLAGVFGGTIDFDPGAGVFNLSGSYSDVFMLKLDNGGNFVWAKSFTGSYESHSATIDIDASGNACLSGYFIGTTDFDPGAGVFNLTSATSGFMDVFILKLDPSGNFVWAKQVGGAQDDFCYSLAIDATGNIYATGSFHNTVDFDPGAGVLNLTTNSSFYCDMFVLKLDPSGNLIWAKSMGGPADEYGMSLATDASGNVYTTGTFSDTVDFDPGPGIFNLNSGYMFISKLDASGSFIWAKSLNALPASVISDAAGNVYTTGTFIGTVDFDPGSGVVNLIGNSIIYNDMFVSKLDASGNFKWAVNLGGTSSINGYTITTDAVNVYTCGVYFGLIDFDQGSGVFNLPVNDHDIFVHKMKQEGVSGLSENVNQSKINVFPNPTGNLLNIQSTDKIMEISIINYLDEVVNSVINLNDPVTWINLSSLPKGLYLLNIKTESKSVTKKIFKE